MGAGNSVVATLQAALRMVPVYPVPESVGLCQDRLIEKDFLTEKDERCNVESDSVQ